MSTSTRSGRVRQSTIDTSPSRVRKGISPTRSPARSRKSSPPARSSRKSPSRKSPSRKSTAQSPKYPARKSPSRTVKENVESVETDIPKSPARRPAIKTNAIVKQEDVSAKYEIYRSTRSKRAEYSVKDIPSGFTSTDVTDGGKLNGDYLDTEISSYNDIYSLRNRRSVENAPPRRLSKLRDFTDSVLDIRRSFSKSLSNSLSKSISQSVDAFSDEENSEEEIRKQKEKSRSTTRKLATPVPSMDIFRPTGRLEFGGQPGCAALLIFVPLTVFAILMSCTKSCSYKTLIDLYTYKSYTWFSKQSLILMISQYIIQAVLLLTPILGKRFKNVDATGREYCFNGCFAILFTFVSLLTVDYFKILNMSTILSLYLELAFISYAFGVVLSFILFLRSRQVLGNSLNQYGNTGYTIYDFFMGREIYPYINKLNVKLWLSRVTNISTLVLTILIFKHGIELPENFRNFSMENYKEFFSMVHFKATILVFATMQMFYIFINFIVKEHQITSTFYWQSEGIGYLQIISSCLYPFYFTTISKFVIDTDLNLTTNTLIAASVLYVLGFVIMFLSNNIKYEFRRNPLQSSLAHLESMPTFLGKKLVVSGLWGVLRHPNYAGDILIHISLALPGVLSQHIVAAAPAIITILVLLHRSWRDHARCKQRYGAAWHRYCKRVPSTIIPNIL